MEKSSRTICAFAPPVWKIAPLARRSVRVAVSTDSGENTAAEVSTS